MSQFTDYGENKIADFMRGLGLSLPGGWYFALGTAAADSSFTEIVVTGYSRTLISRAAASFDNTQKDLTTAASIGTSHKTANTNAISFGSPSGSAVTATHVGLFDASSAGNCWIWLPLDASISVGGGAAVSIGAGLVAFVLGLSSGCSDYLANQLVDLIFRGLAFSWPATIYLAGYTVTPTNAGGGTEVAALDYSRVALVPSATSLSGTQAPGSTTASTGTGGVISNNAILAYPLATSAWGTVVAAAFLDAPSGGNLLLWGPLSAAKTVGTTAPLSFAAGTVAITIA